MKNIHITNSYSIWTIPRMKAEIWRQCRLKYDTPRADLILHRSWEGMYIEWYLHNIGYYMTLPFCGIGFMKKLNERFKHVDIQGYYKREY